MLYRRKRDFEAASAFFFEPTHGLIEPHLKGNNPSEWQDTYGKTKRVPAFVATRSSSLLPDAIAISCGRRPLGAFRGLVQPNQRADDRRVISGIVHTESGCVGLHP